MPSTIILRSPDSIDDKRIRLSNSQFGRPFSVGSWTKLRVCFRFGFTDYGTNLPGTVLSYMGLCSGTTNMLGDNTCQHFVGHGIVGAYTRSGTLPNLIYTTGAPFFYKKVGTTFTPTLSQSNGAGYGAMADTDGKQRFALFIEYLRVSPTAIQLTSFYRLNTNGGGDISYNDWLAAAETEVGLTYSLHSWGTARQLTVDEGTDGVLDTVTAHWSRTSPQMEISDIAVVKFA